MTHAQIYTMLRILRGAGLALLVAAVAAWPVDWAVWRIRNANGGGMGQVAVAHFTVTAIKGGKDEYFSDGVAPEPCSRSLFPEAGSGPCWWLERTHQILVRF